MKLRGILPFIFPTWLIAYPTICYFRETGRFIPDEETRTFMYSSSGPWSHDVAIVFLLSLLVAIPLHLGFIWYYAIFRQRGNLIAWLIGSGVGIVTAGLALYWFGNLMDI